MEQPTPSRAAGTNRSTSYYREFPPLPSLAKYLVCVWTQTITGSPCQYKQHVLPDACIDVVFMNQDAPIVVGPWTTPFVTDLVCGTSIVGARFRPGWGPSLLGIPACELVNQTLQLRTILDAKVEERFHRAVHARTLPERLSSLQTALLHRLADSEPLDFTIDAAVRWLAHNPHGRIDSLSRYIGYSPRQLQRRFTATVGYGPKLLHSVLRFQRLLALASRATMPHLLCEIAAEAGYADQAHMSREVRRFTGRRPSEVLSSAHTTLDLSDLFKTPQDTGIQT